MDSQHSLKDGYLMVVPWGLHHIGGVNQAVLDLRSQLSQNDRLQPVVLITETGHDKLEVISSEASLREYRLTLPQPIIRGHVLKSALSYLVRLPWLFMRLRRVLIDERVSTINVHYPTLAELTLLLAARLSGQRIKVVLSFHGLDVAEYESASGWYRRLWDTFLARADRVVTCSDSLGVKLSAIVRSTRKPISTVHNGVDQSLLKRCAERGRVPEALAGKNFILNVATLEWKKGQDILVKAFSRLVGRFPDLMLGIMGRPGELERDLRSLISELDLDDRILIFENVSHDDVLATMKNAELFVLPSRIEPFGIVLLEAATLGTPVIAARTGGIPEIIMHDKCGLLVSVEDVDGLAVSMAKLLDDRKKASRLADQMYDRVSAEFSLESVARKYESMAGTGGS